MVELFLGIFKAWIQRLHGRYADQVLRSPACWLADKRCVGCLGCCPSTRCQVDVRPCRASYDPRRGNVPCHLGPARRKVQPRAALDVLHPRAALLPLSQEGS
eukprot:scaffold3187_cov361-Prasinococcus_capsulatus_cf.AAC.13